MNKNDYQHGPPPAAHTHELIWLKKRVNQSKYLCEKKKKFDLLRTKFFVI